ncbi:hypothetical protein [Methylobacterium sp. WL116]|uniref:hypothetical protein n=1 Tax=Methylobacterium sp. WL116 TaxID=2603889 RepID=UPI0011C8AB09|nr:hypothetical protein [Methylobacterium sp. WL116]TXM95528.1 hypothetical protein FV223_00185 [Methylobacterium sp. WL116]
MRFLTTTMTAMAVCTAFLVGAAFWIDAPDRNVQSTGLTAATVLGTDGMAPLARPSDPGAVASGYADVVVGDQG